MHLVEMLDRHHRVTVVPFQKAGVPDAYGLTLAQCEASAWAITPRHQRYPGAAAINLAVAVALGVSIPLWVYAIPGIRHIQDAVYRWVVRNRHRLPGVVPYCERYPDQCR